MRDLQAPRVAVIGLGRMGAAMATNLRDAGLEVSGYDIDPARMALFAGTPFAATRSPAHACDGAGIVVVMVHDQAQVDEVLFGASGAIQVLPAGAAVWLASTVPPAYAKRLAARLTERGILFVDGPVTGGTTFACSGELTAIAGGDAEALRAARPALDACTARVFHVGPAGAGSAVKMVNQLMVAVHSIITGEAMVLAAGTGIDPDKLIDVITHSAGSSVIFNKRASRIAAGEHEVQVSIATLRKDLDIALQAARDFKLRLPLAEKALEILDEAVAGGRGDLSDTQLI